MICREGKMVEWEIHREKRGEGGGGRGKMDSDGTARCPESQAMGLCTITTYNNFCYLLRSRIPHL